MSKFKVGDMVIGNSEANRYGITRKGWIGRVTRDDGVKWFTAVGEDGRRFVHLYEDCFDLITVPTERKVVITTDGETTLARLYNGKKVVMSAEAKCSPKDKFDFKKGAEIAFNRLLEKESEKPEAPEARKPYNGKVVCVNPRHNCFYTKGKIYQITNGVITCDDGDKIFAFNPVCSFEELCRESSSEWLEIVE